MLVLLAVVALTSGILALLCSWKEHALTTERLNEFEREIREARALLEKRGQLADELAHEIKNPLSAILCSAEALEVLVGHKLDESQRKCLSYIREYGDNLLRLVSDFIDLSRLESNRIAAHIKPTRFRPVLDSVVGLIETLAQRKNISTKIELESEQLTGLIDNRHLKQILFNLLHNALKFTPPGGTITVRAHKVLDHHIALMIEDSGSGIEKERIETIFDPYNRAAAASEETSAEHGLGLGLAICKSLATLCNCTIAVHSTVGKGTCFTVTIPSAEGVQITELAQSEPIHQPLMGKSFLLVDSHTASRDALAELIQAWGGMVDQVNFATEAVQALTQKNYDTVMLDPEGNDEHCVSDLLSKGSAHEMIVASADKGSLARALEEKGLQCLEKPLNSSELLEVLRSSNKVV